MTEIILYLDPALFAACYSVDKDMRGRDWIVQNCTQAKDNHWFYALHNIYAIDVLRKHVSRAQMASSQSEDCTVEGLSIKSLKKEYLSR